MLSAGAAGTCCFCDAVDVPAASLEDVLAFIRDGLEAVWSTQPDDRIDWDWDQGPVPHSYSLEDVLEAAGSPIKNKRAIGEIEKADGFGTWYDRYADGSGPYARLDLWDEFCRRILYKSRFFFCRPMAGDPAECDPSELPSVEVLDDLADLVREAGLVREVPAGERFFRARQHYPHDQPRTASELGPPPKAGQANRMSPAGIVMFYGASEVDTALREVSDAQGVERGKTRLTVGAFVTTQTFKVVDLTHSSLPQIPSIFDAKRRSIRQGILFLHRFVKEVARPIAKDGREHVDYVPTQVVTEYVRHVFKDQGGKPVRGILYSSSQKDGGSCCVLFVESDECGGDASARFQPRTQWLRFDDRTTEHFDLQIQAEPRFVRLSGA